MSHKLSQSDSINSKLLTITYGLCICTGIIIIRLIYLQIYCGAQFLELSKKNYERTRTTLPARGGILDCNGTPIATNRPITNIYWQGTGNKRLHDNQTEILQNLEKILEKTLDAPFIKHVAHAEKTRKKLLIANNLSRAHLSNILEYYGNHPNLSFETTFKRFYPYQNAAAHMVGYIGEAQQQTSGKMGLEKMLDELLRGNSGQQRVTINSLGKSLLVEEIERATNGADIKTTLDIGLQLLAESLLPEDTKGSFIIMNPKNGDLRVVLSRPSFDPNIFTDPLSQQTWQALQYHNPLLNRAFNACYPPASIFKLVTAAAALEEKIINPDDTHECRGYITFARRRYYCMRHSGHGTVSVKEALALSCNPLFYSIGKKISINTLAHYAHLFGLGLPTQIILPEKIGLIPTTTWKERTFGQRWWPGETLSVAIGQSYLLSTPLQIACMISSIFEGYLVKPRILASELMSTRQLPISYKTRAFLQDSMRLAVTEGTGRRVSSVHDINIWAKTGTGQTKDRERKKQGNEFDRDADNYAWFVAYFQYKNHEPLTMVILMEDCESSLDATILAKQFLVQYRLLMQERDAQ